MESEFMQLMLMSLFPSQLMPRSCTPPLAGSCGLVLFEGSLSVYPAGVPSSLAKVHTCRAHGLFILSHVGPFYSKNHRCIEACFPVCICAIHLIF